RNRAERTSALRARPAVLALASSGAPGARRLAIELDSALLRRRLSHRDIVSSIPREALDGRGSEGLSIAHRTQRAGPRWGDDGDRPVPLPARLPDAAVARWTGAGREARPRRRLRASGRRSTHVIDVAASRRRQV